MSASRGNDPSLLHYLYVMNAKHLLPAILLSLFCGSGYAQSGSFEYVHGSKVNRVLARDDDEVWMTLDGGVIRYSTDGGSSFLNSTVPDSIRSALEGICLVEDGGSTHMWAVGAEGVVLKSTDSGASWSHVATLTAPPGWPTSTTDGSVYLRDVSFANSSRGIAVADADLCYLSNDGGSNWTQFTTGGSPHFDLDWYRIHSFSSSSFYIVGTDRWVCPVGFNGGGGALGTKTEIPVDPSWYGVQFPQNGSRVIDLWDVEFVGSHGLAVGGHSSANGYVFESSDSGATWSLYTDCYDRSTVFDGFGGGVIPPTFWGVELFGGTSHIALAGYGSSVHVLPQSTVSGYQIPLDPSPPFNPSTCSPADLQMVPCDDDALSSTTEEDGTNPFLLDIEASDSGDVTWVVGDMGVVRVSLDHGETWSNVAGKHRTRIEGCDFASMSVGMSFGQLQRVMWTTDGGENWDLELDGGGGSETLRAGDISSLGILAVVVGDGGVVALRDSGGSWSTKTLTGLPDLHSVAMTDDGTGIVACGNGGEVFTSTDSGGAFTQGMLQFGGGGVSADLVQLLRMAGKVFYLSSDNYVYIANESTHTSAYTRLPLVDASSMTPTAEPTAFGIRVVSGVADIMAGNEDGDLFRYSSMTGKLHLVVTSGGSLAPDSVVRVEPVPGNSDWFAGGSRGDVLRFDGSTWSAPKTSMKAVSQPVNGLEFFAAAGGGFEGLLMSRRSTVCVWLP